MTACVNWLKNTNCDHDDVPAVMKKIFFVATIPAVVNSFLREHIRAASGKWEIRIISHPEGSALLNDLNAKFIPLAFTRKPSPFHDLLSLIQLTKLFRREHPDLIHSIMPKTGLLCMVAGWAAGVPVRMHTFTGQVWANKRGWKRLALKMFDKLIVLFATHIVVDSPSQRDFLVAEGVLAAGQGLVIGQGSICGVDVQRFHPDAKERQRVRAELGLNLQQPVILYLGRLTRDKGILDLAAAFAEIAPQRPDAVLMLVGAEEDVPFARVQEICGRYREQLCRVSFTPTPERYMASADIFCLPSYREGFGQVIIEAGASEVPTVASRIYGVTDAVEDGKSGLLFQAGDVTALRGALLTLLENETLRRQMGDAAQARALELFSSQKITAEMLGIYTKLLG